MKQFIYKYILFLLLFFLLLYSDTFVFSKVLNEIQTNITLFFLDIFLDKGQLNGIDIWISANYKIIITHSCNGMVPIILMFSSISAFPSSLFHKFIWLIISYLVFVAVNTGRILMVVYFVEKEGGRDNFYLSHDVFGNFLLIGAGLMLFMFFIKLSKRTEV